jgi:hypothetical protein
MFNLFFQQHMELTLAQIGTLGGIGGVWTVALFYFAGVPADRFHPLRTLLLAVTLSTFLFVPIWLIWLFINPSPQAFSYVCLAQGLVFAPAGVLQGVNGSDYAYRFMSAWTFGFSLLAYICLLLVYREWKRLGGDKTFVPPDAGCTTGVSV